MTDYIGLGGIKDANIFGEYKCRIRILDSFGTDPLCMFVCLLLLAVTYVHTVSIIMLMYSVFYPRVHPVIRR